MIQKKFSLFTVFNNDFCMFQKKKLLFIFRSSASVFLCDSMRDCKKLCCRSSASLSICKFISCNVKNLSSLDFVSCLHWRATLFFSFSWFGALINEPFNSSFSPSITLLSVFFSLCSVTLLPPTIFSFPILSFSLSCVLSTLKTVYGIFGILW